VSEDLLGKWAMNLMLINVSTRKFGRAVRLPEGDVPAPKGAGVSKSAVSRRFVAATETALAELMTRRLDDLDLVALMIDGVHFGEHTCVVALGIGIDGTKHPLAVEEGSTENATLVTDLITGLRDRGLDVTRPVLAVLDGAKALSRAVKDVFDKPLFQRRQQHKIKMQGTNCPTSSGPSPRSGCARPTTPARPSRPRACSQRSPASSIRPTPALPPRCGKACSTR
jgi:transposase-like protein